MHTYAYEAPEGLGPLNEWTATQHAELAEPIGSVEAVKGRLQELFASLQWQRSGNGWCGNQRTCEEPYVFIVLTEDSGYCRYIVLDKPDRSVLQRVMHSFGLNYACTPENGKLISVDG